MNEAISDAVADADLGLIPEREARHAAVIRMGEGERVDTKTIEPVLHDDAGRRAVSMVSIETSDLASHGWKARAALNGQVYPPQGYRIEVGEPFHQLEAVRTRV